MNGDRSEREIQLQEELQSERRRSVTLESEKRDRETRIAELEDELNALRNPPAPEPPAKKSVRLGFYKFEE